VRHHLDRGWPVGGEQGHRGRAVEVRVDGEAEVDDGRAKAGAQRGCRAEEDEAWRGRAYPRVTLFFDILQVRSIQSLANVVLLVPALLNISRIRHLLQL
jgi:hypothetical protein